MKKIILLFAVVGVLGFFSTQIFAQQRRARQNRMANVPEGVVMRGKAAFVKRGYKFVRLGSNRAAVQREDGTTITGEFVCQCMGSNGTCEIKYGRNSIRCRRVSCTMDCLLYAAIDGIPPTGQNRSSRRSSKRVLPR